MEVVPCRGIRRERVVREGSGADVECKRVRLGRAVSSVSQSWWEELIEMACVRVRGLVSVKTDDTHKAWVPVRLAERLVDVDRERVARVWSRLSYTGLVHVLMSLVTKTDRGGDVEKVFFEWLRHGGEVVHQ